MMFHSYKNVRSADLDGLDKAISITMFKVRAFRNKAELGCNVLGNQQPHINVPS